MKRRNDGLDFFRGCINATLISLPIWAGILVLVFNLARAWAHYPQWSWIVK